MARNNAEEEIHVQFVKEENLYNNKIFHKNAPSKKFM